MTSNYDHDTTDQNYMLHIIFWFSYINFLSVPQASILCKKLVNAFFNIWSANDTGYICKTFVHLRKVKYEFWLNWNVTEYNSIGLCWS